MVVKSIREDDELVKLVEAMQMCSAGDLSVLEAMIFAEGEPSGITGEGSANYRLWNLLAERGWLVEVAPSLFEAIRLSLRALIRPFLSVRIKTDVKEFKLVAEGRIPIYQLLRRFGPFSSGEASPVKSKQNMLNEMSLRVQEFARSDVLVPMAHARFDSAAILSIFSFMLAKGIHDMGNVEKKFEGIDLVAANAKKILSSLKPK